LTETDINYINKVVPTDLVGECRCSVSGHAWTNINTTADTSAVSTFTCRQQTMAHYLAVVDCSLREADMSKDYQNFFIQLMKSDEYVTLINDNIATAKEAGRSLDRL